MLGKGRQDEKDGSSFNTQFMSICTKPMAAGAPLWTPLGELTTLPRNPMSNLFRQYASLFRAFGTLFCADAYKHNFRRIPPPPTSHLGSVPGIDKATGLPVKWANLTVRLQINYILECNNCVLLLEWVD